MFGASTSAARPVRAMTFAIVYVLPEPVTPSSVWYASPSVSPSISFSIASGWSPAGWNGWLSSKGLFGYVTIMGVDAEGNRLV